MGEKAPPSATAATLSQRETLGDSPLFGMDGRRLAAIQGNVGMLKEACSVDERLCQCKEELSKNSNFEIIITGHLPGPIGGTGGQKATAIVTFLYSEITSSFMVQVVT